LQENAKGTLVKRERTDGKKDLTTKGESDEIRAKQDGTENDYG
jgi:hypothetical protein